MPISRWLFIVSAALFISGIAFVIAGARLARHGTAASTADTAIPPVVATVKQNMTAVVLPNATVIYNAVGSTETKNGVEERAPRNDGEWAAVGASAAALVESGRFLLGERAIDRGDWVTMTRTYIEAGNAALKAANEKNPDGILIAGGSLNETCDACHAKYSRQ